MRATVEAELAALAEGLATAVDAAHEGLLVGMRVLMFAEVLRQGKNFIAELAGKSLPPRVDVVVALE